jgi:hypothetical protein
MGLYCILGPASKERVTAAAGRLRFFDEATEIINEPAFSAAWVGHDDASHFGPAHDPATGVRVITSGRVAWEEEEWRRAEGLTQFHGGLCNRLLLEQYLAHGPKGVERHNGAAALVVWDPRDLIVHLFVDHFGYHPIFLYKDGAVISTFPDAIAHDPECPTTPDELAMAELLSAWRVTPPHTFYQEIKHPGAATHTKWNLATGASSKREYWRPFEEAPFATLEEATEALAQATRESIRIRTLPRFAPHVCFISGGLDSRTILFSSGDRARTIGFNMFDQPNREAEISKTLCDAAGVRYVGFQRDDDYYPRWHEESSRISGAMLSTEDSHYLGVQDKIMALGARTVLTGCTTDWIFKGYGLEKRYERLLGRDLPFFKFTEQRTDAFLPNHPGPLSPEIEPLVKQRRAALFDAFPAILATERDRLLVESQRCRPICYAPSVSSQIMYRIFPYDTFLADRRMADCYSRIQASWKLNSEVWAGAVRRICRGGENVSDVNFGWKVGASKPAKLLSFAKSWIGRRVKSGPKPQGPQLATSGSWPNLGWYALHSKTLAAIWNGVPPEHRSLIAKLLGKNPWDRPLADYLWEANFLLRVLTVAMHLKHRP